MLDVVTADGVHLRAERRAAHGARRGAVVVIHGFAASGSEVHVTSLADALQGSGLDVLTYDSRGHGASGGAATLGDLERLDVEAATNSIATDDLPVLLVGASMGAIGALRYAAGGDSRVSGVVTVSCPARWRLPRNARGVLSAMLTQTGVGRAFARRSMKVRIARGFSRSAPPVELVTRIDAPIAFIHGRADPFIPPTDAELLHAAGRTPKRLTLVDGMGHAFEPPATAEVLASVDWILASRS